MANELKHLMAEEIREEIASSPNLLVVGLQPMDAEANHELRSNLRDLGARLRVIPNRTSRFALGDERERLAEHFRGQTALTLLPGERDIIGVAKAIVDAARKKIVEVRGGWVDGESLDKAGVETLAQTPDKPTLRAILLGATLGPARGIAAAMNCVAAGIARCLQARIDESGETPNES